MSKSIFKNITLSLTLIFLALIITFCGNSFTSDGATLNSDDDYFLIYVQNTPEGHTLFGLEIGINFKDLNKNQIEFENFKLKLINTVNNIKNQEKNYLLEKNNIEGKEKFDFDKNVSFKESTFDYDDNFISYIIDFSSFEVFQYFYDNVNNENKEGFLLSKMSISFSSPYQTEIYSDVSRKDYYLESIKACGKGLSFESYFSNWQPGLYFDFVTLNGRAKSSADVKGIDNLDNYHHIWNLSENNSKKMDINLNIVNKGWWYLLGTLIPLVIMSFAIIVVIVKKKMVDKNSNN